LKKLILLLTIFTIVLNINSIHAQIEKYTDSAKVFYLRGRIVDEEKKPIVFAHVINKLREHATITDSSGYFKIPVVYKDSIRISAIGFYTKYLWIKEKNLKDSTFHIIEMAKKTYDIATVNIYELRWQIFKSEFMEEKVEEDKTAIRISNWMANLLPAGELRMIYQSTMAPGFAINWKTKADKSRKKVAELEKKYQLIAPKFNDKMVSAVTGLQGKEIYNFVQFCNFDENFLIQATEYEIMEKLLEHWIEYQKKNQVKKK